MAVMDLRRLARRRRIQSFELLPLGLTCNHGLSIPQARVIGCTFEHNSRVEWDYGYNPLDGLLSSLKVHLIIGNDICPSFYESGSNAGPYDREGDP